jgi:hypothetical protein
MEKEKSSQTLVKSVVELVELEKGEGLKLLFLLE